MKANNANESVACKPSQAAAPNISQHLQSETEKLVCGCIGKSLQHSFSCEIHHHLADYDYQLWELQPDQLGAFLQKQRYDGINVTIPYKEAVIPYLDHLSPEAQQIGAVNTIVRRSGKTFGYNTDMCGMTALIKRADISLVGKKTVIIGTGGTAKTARAVAAACGAERIITVSRTPGKADCTYDKMYECHADAAVLINTTPVGMYPNIDEIPVDLSRLPALTGVIDAIYNPMRTRLVQEARRSGIRASGGLYMLVRQAAEAAALFLGAVGKCAMTEQVFSAISHEKQNIVLIGMPGCGKSTVANLLGNTLQRVVIDTDDEIRQTIQMPIADYIRKFGETAFRQQEAQVIRSLATQRTGCIIATGGGAVLNDASVMYLRQNGKLFFIDCDEALLQPTADRPLSQDRSALHQRYIERYALYCRAADERIISDHIATHTANKIKERFFL